MSGRVRSGKAAAEISSSRPGEQRERQNDRRHGRRCPAAAAAGEARRRARPKVETSRYQVWPARLARAVSGPWPSKQLAQPLRALALGPAAVVGVDQEVVEQVGPPDPGGDHGQRRQRRRRRDAPAEGEDDHGDDVRPRTVTIRLWTAQSAAVDAPRADAPGRRARASAAASEAAEGDQPDADQREEGVLGHRGLGEHGERRVGGAGERRPHRDPRRDAGEARQQHVEEGEDGRRQERHWGRARGGSRAPGRSAASSSGAITSE